MFQTTNPLSHMFVVYANMEVFMEIRQLKSYYQRELESKDNMIEVSVHFLFFSFQSSLSKQSPP